MPAEVGDRVKMRSYHRYGGQLGTVVDVYYQKAQKYVNTRRFRGYRDTSLRSYIVQLDGGRKIKCPKQFDSIDEIA